MIERRNDNQRAAGRSVKSESTTAQLAENALFDPRSSHRERFARRPAGAVLDEFCRVRTFGEEIREGELLDVGLRRDRNPLEVVTTSYVARVKADAIKQPAIIRNPIVSVLDDCSKPLILKFFHFIPRRARMTPKREYIRAGGSPRR